MNKTLVSTSNRVNLNVRDMVHEMAYDSVNGVVWWTVKHQVRDPVFAVVLHQIQNQVWWATQYEEGEYFESLFR